MGRESDFKCIMDISGNYLRSLSISDSEIHKILNPQLFSEGVIMSLPVVCIVRENRPPKSKTNQTHIHITGDAMRLFYSDTILHQRMNRKDEQIRIECINANVDHLNLIRKARKMNVEMPKFALKDSIRLVSTKTVKKLGHNGTQVQLSKKSVDGACFTRLRDGLLPNDLLLFLKYSGQQDSYLVIGIPGSDLKQQTKGWKPTFLSNAMSGNLHAGNESFRIGLNSVTSANIASYNFSDNESAEEGEGKGKDNGVGALRTRTERHHGIVRQLALLMEQGGLKLYAGNIDCLAVKNSALAMLFEVKTLDGSPSDEARQVRTALGQLLYYERFAMEEFTGLPTQKIAVFESKISEEHIKFLYQYNCLTLWRDEKRGFSGNTTAVSLLHGLNI